MSDLALFTNGTDTIVARDVDDAWQLYAEVMGGYECGAACRADVLKEHEGNEFVRILDTADVTMFDDSQGAPVKVTAPARHWTSRFDRGVMWSTEF